MSFTDMHILSAYLSRPASVLRVSGEDHIDFLHNQGTADLRGEPGICKYSLWLDFQGKIHFDSFVLKLSNEAMILVSYESPAGSLIEKFNKHIIADDVEIVDETDAWQLLSSPPGQIEAGPEPGSFMRKGSGYAYSGRLMGPGSVDLLLPKSDKLLESFDSLSADQAQNFRIAAGIPMVPTDTGTGQFNPVECGILSAVSFDKGCFLGQEVVARVHRLERTSRRLVRFLGKGPAPEVPLNIVKDESTLGCITSVSENPDGFIALGWLRTRFPDGDFSHDKIDFRVQSLDPS